MLCCCRCYCRYLCGSVLTYVDIRLFMTLIRFDEVYVVYFKVSFRVFIVCILLFFSSLMLTVHFSIWQCNIRELSTYPNITNYMRELYQNETIQSVINMQHIKGHYFTSHVTLNTHGYDTPVYVIEHLLLIRIAEWQCGDHMFVLLILMYCIVLYCIVLYSVIVFRIIPKGPNVVGNMLLPHDRGKLFPLSSA